MAGMFDPIKIGTLEIKNRFVVPPMVACYIGPDGICNKKFTEYHKHKARGGWGLIITEDFKVTKTAGGFNGLPGLWEDAQIPSWKKFTEEIHAEGGTIAAQIYHAGRVAPSAFNYGAQPVAPSPVKDPTMTETPRELSVEEIHELVEAFGDCARRAKEAGFDAVEVHGAHGYLICEFASGFSNKRTDEYGGSLRNRFRFPVEIVRNIKEKCGEDFPVIYRMSVEEYVTGGLTPAETQVLAKFVTRAGANAIHCSLGNYQTTHLTIPPSCSARAPYVDNIEKIKEVVDVPVIAVSRINDPEIAANIVETGKADLCSMGRASLADPEMPNKYKEGRYEDINYCIGCLQGCIGENLYGHCVRCLVEPLTGMEDEYDLSPAKEKRSVLIIGGGVAGCEAAISAARKGHKVTLAEKSGSLGGQWKLAATPLGKAEYSSFASWQKAQVEKLGVDIRLNTSVDEAFLDEIKPDKVILATGGIPFKPGVDGKDRDFVITAHELLAGTKDFGKNVVIIGGGLVGAETADAIADHCSNVKVVEMLPEIMADGEPNPKTFMMERYKAKGIEVYTSTKLLSVGDHCVVCEKDNQKLLFSDVDTVVMAVGSKGDTSLAELLEKKGLDYVTIGAATGEKSGYIAIRAGYEAGLNI